MMVMFTRKKNADTKLSKGNEFDNNNDIYFR